jgi:hypothetical protein
VTVDRVAGVRTEFDEVPLSRGIATALCSILGVAAVGGAVAGAGESSSAALGVGVRDWLRGRTGFFARCNSLVKIASVATAIPIPVSTSTPNTKNQVGRRLREWCFSVDARFIAIRVGRRGLVYTAK